MASHNDPIAKAIASLTQKGVSHGVFLEIAPNPSGQGIPIFIARSGFGSQQHFILWTGLKWDPQLVPDVWNAFVKEGITEFPPPGVKTDINSVRNVMRGAYGVNPGEWLTLIRLGPPNACYGILALYSKAGIKQSVNSLVQVFSALPATKAA